MNDLSADQRTLLTELVAQALRLADKLALYDAGLHLNNALVSLDGTGLSPPAHYGADLETLPPPEC